mmetsp:Transcript_27498/g.27719  ORF Transcript_27498/g.27719 Transcript_27498/m.27719 type:complete len:234 (-) Transcript_27498:44-745(-)|eukprot:CAMPEP_0182428672 /NCGR_PEP_ID=MMETSP1167-20130531/23198_1 /TAXON_ID=2988 /ORGANISM="Mallomonas Sp, Strain CCMP3275" /LENGTH=233 /DNA_ID=CAMNT_0024611695 /DNA_START=18 /DNA_END=719 /DNA_ORIENTATION=+
MSSLNLAIGFLLTACFVTDAFKVSQQRYSANRFTASWLDSRTSIKPIISLQHLACTPDDNDVTPEVLDAEVVGMPESEGQLDKGELENIEFTRLEKISPKIAKYRVAGLLDVAQLDSYLAEYKEEMKRRKVKFPGFRAGVLPPFAMTDVRRYIVSYGLELNIGTLCDMNNLILCDKSGEEVTFGQDEYFQEIVCKDETGNDFFAQRDAWREGNEFNFELEFYAKVGDEEEGSE